MEGAAVIGPSPVIRSRFAQERKRSRIRQNSVSRLWLSLEQRANSGESGDSAIPNDRSGLTLVEMLIALSVLAILAAVVLPAVRSTEAQSLESVVRVVAADLRLARAAAIQCGTEWTVRFDPATNAYELVHTGAGSPPALSNPLAAAGEPTDRYLVRLDRFAPAKSPGRFRLAAVSLKDSGQPVSDVTFGPLGGTGPARAEDTVIWLTTGAGPETQAVRLTISWITGQVWIGRPEMYGL